MVEQFTCNSTCDTFDTSLLIVFKPLSSNRGGTHFSGLRYVTNSFFKKVQVADEAQQLRVSTYPWAGWRDLIGSADMLHMCLITHQGAGMILAQTWHILQWVNAVYVLHNQPEKSRVHWYGRRESVSSRYVQQIVPLSPGSGLCVLPSSAHVPQES